MGFDLVHHELSVRLLGDRGMRQLNRRWRDRDRTTDVLSFPQWDAARRGVLQPARWQGRPLCLGDLVVSMPRAAAQAAQQRHPVDVELCHLFVHGLLHLMGHDHEGPRRAARRMQAAEGRTLGALGLRPAGLLARQKALC